MVIFTARRLVAILAELPATLREKIRSATGTHHSIIITNRPPVSHLAAALIPVL
jgi:hypothetical protein